MKRRSFRLHLLGAGLSVALLTAAQAANDPPPAVLKVLEARGLRGLKEFPSDGGIRAFAGLAGQDPIAVYVLKDGSAILGTRISATGASLDAKAIDELVTKPMMDAAWQRLADSRWIQDGSPNAPRVVYQITDANCPWCHRFWEAARPWVNTGKVQIRHLFVGVIRADSAAKAAAILEAKDPVGTLARNERTFDQGGVAPLKSIAPASQKTLESNYRLMAELGFRGTPGLIYRGSDGSVQTLGGYPKGPQLDEVLGPR